MGAIIPPSAESEAEKHHAPLNLSMVPTADLRAEIERRRGDKPGPMPKLEQCPKCLRWLSARAIRISCKRNHEK